MRTRTALGYLARFCLIALAPMSVACSDDSASTPEQPAPSGLSLAGFASLPAATFAEGPASGARLGKDPIHGQTPPFSSQPVQGFSAVVDRKDGTFLAMTDNGFETLENSSDFHLRVYTIRPDLRAEAGGTGKIEVLSHIELRDPDKKIPFAITNQFSTERVLTGADFDIESMVRAPDGSLWFGDELGPFLLHTDAEGRVLGPPIALPDFDGGSGAELRSPQSPLQEEASAVRVMNAVRAHAASHGNTHTPVFSPADTLLVDGDEKTAVANRAAPPEGSGVISASSEIFDVKSLHDAGYPVVPYTVNVPERMQTLLKLGVDGLISDRPDLLRSVIEAYDADGDGKGGDLLDADGLVDVTRFAAQGHRGGRDLRPENTLPAMEVALDNLMTTLETDTGFTKDGMLVLNHDPLIRAQKCRHADGTTYEAKDEVLIKDLTAAEIQEQFICDKLFRGPSQLNDPALSPVATAFATAQKIPNIYVMPKLTQLFDFVDSYIEYYTKGAGSANPEAKKRSMNAARVRFNLETKINPRAKFKDRTVGPEMFADTLASAILARKLEARADIQSFDFRTLLRVHEKYPTIRTVFLFGDFPIYADTSIAGTDDGTNLQDENGANTPWLAGLAWPYRKTAAAQPFRVKKSAGFEGLAMTPDGAMLLPMLEQPLADDDGAKTLLIHPFDLAKGAYTGERYLYKLDARGTSIGDFAMVDDKHGLVIERDESEGDLSGFKSVYRIELGANSAPVSKEAIVDLLSIPDPKGLAGAGASGDVGLGATFALPFKGVEGLVVLDETRIGVLNDNNFPFGAGRHKGASLPDDTEMAVIKLGSPLR